MAELGWTQMSLVHSLLNLFNIHSHKINKLFNVMCYLLRNVLCAGFNADFLHSSRKLVTWESLEYVYTPQLMTTAIFRFEHVYTLSCCSHVWLFVTTWTVYHVLFFVTPWTIAQQSPLFMRLSRQAYWSGYACSPPGDLPNTGVEPESLMSLALTRGFSTTNATWKAQICAYKPLKDNVYIYMQGLITFNNII